MSKEAMTLALEALKSISEMVDYEGNGFKLEYEIKALEEALAKQEQQVVSLQCAHCQVTIDTLNNKVMSLLAKQEQRSVSEQLGEPVAWRYDQAKYRENDLRGRQWVFNVFSQARPYMDEMVQNVTPLYTTPQPKQEQGKPIEVRLWDSQWINVVNHDNCYQKWSKEDAINHAVKMTENYIASNVASNKLPPQPAQKPLTDKQREEIAKGWRGRNWTVGDIIDAIEAAHGIKE